MIVITPLALGIIKRILPLISATERGTIATGALRQENDLFTEAKTVRDCASTPEP